MPIIKSISGIRGTLGEKMGEGLDPVLIVQYCLAFATLLKTENKKKITVVVGRDGRVSGEILESLVVSTLRAAGVDVIQTGYTTTPTLEMAVIMSKADAGIILTASHNPANWNALKFFNKNGEFISPETGKKLLELIEKNDFICADEKNLGNISYDDTFMHKHVEAVLNLPIINKKAIADAGFFVVADVINSTGGLILPILFDALNVKYKIINNSDYGKFAHNPEPLPQHLTELSSEVVANKADLGISVDPDVDRLALICENGEMFGEEYTLVAAADFVLSHKTGNTVSNLSSSQALKDITLQKGGKHYASAVGEVNVVNKMKEVDAVIGGEGNGGVIYPELHYGRDAVVGIAIVLSLLAEQKKAISQIRKSYPEYFISKNKIELNPNTDLDNVLAEIEKKFAQNCENIIKIDGLKIEFKNEWVHLRKSNTEPIIRIYAESSSMEKANEISEKFIEIILSIIK